MDKIEIHYNRRTPEVIEAEEVVSGQRGTVEVQFSFSEEWERYPIRSASFSSSADEGTWPLEEDKVKIPESIIVYGVRSFTVSVFGLRETEDGKIERYNGKPAAFRVEIGGDVPGEGCDKSPTAYEQLLIRLEKKIDKNQGTSNAGRVLVVGDDGIVRPGEYAGGGGGTITEESDPTVPAWAKQPTKPKYTAEEVGALSESELDSAIDSALAEAKESGEFDGGRGAMILNVTSWPLVYTTETNSLIKYRSPISTVLAQSGASDVKAGDIVWCGTYHYSVLSTDDTYAYMGAYTFIQGATGKSAYSYAQDGGYTGTEKEFSDDLSGIDGKITAPATASVGQTIKVSSVDENGKPTAWEAVDFPEGAGMWEHICDITTTEETSSIEITQNADGVPLSELKYNEIWASAKMIGVSTNAGNWWLLTGTSDQNRLGTAAQSVATNGTTHVSWYLFIRGGKIYNTDGKDIDPYDVTGGNDNWLGNYLDYYNSDHFVSLSVQGANQSIIGIDTEIRIMGRRA